MKFQRLALIGILLGAACLRLTALSSVPPGFFFDEAAEGYDAYSISETMRDQHGKFLPLFLKGLGNDTREALYVYVTAPLMRLVGPSPFAARLPAALIGILTVWILYRLARELFGKHIALLAALLLAISPWHIHFSRTAFRGILLPLFFLLALFFFVKSLKKRKYFITSASFFILSLYSYAAARIFIPLFAAGTLILFWEPLSKMRRQAFFGAGLFLAAFVLLLKVTFTPEAMVRVERVGIETNPARIVERYLYYFSPQFLFIKGDPQIRHNPWHQGTLYPFEALTVLAGIGFLLRRPGRTRRLLALWLLLYPLAAALTGKTEPWGHSIRAIGGIPLFAMLSACGIHQVGEWFGSRKKLYAILLALVVGGSVLSFVKVYFWDYPKYSAKNWQYGLREALVFAKESSYPCVFVSRNFNFAYIQILFHTQYSPALYQESPVDPSNPADQPMGRYHTTFLSEWTQPEDACLYILKPGEKEDLARKGYSLKELKMIHDPSGREAVQIVEVVKS